MDYTANYQLPVWAETDRILRTDFNDAFDTIEDALSQHDSTLDTLETDVAATTTGLAAKGNCQLYVATYIGTGTTSHTLSLPGQAAFFMVIGGGSRCLWGIRGTNPGIVASTVGSHTAASVNLSSQSVTWSSVNAEDACNRSGRTYTLLALLEL